MSSIDFSIRPERVSDASGIETLTTTVFGPGMRARAAYYLREGVDHQAELSFVAEHEGGVVGTVRLTRVYWGDQVVLMLGPLAVLQSLKGKGIGKLLMRTSVDAARQMAGAGGESLIMLVGDLDYYASFGFQQIPPQQISLPRPADQSRILACELQPGVLQGLQGPVTRFSGL